MASTVLHGVADPSSFIAGRSRQSAMFPNLGDLVARTLAITSPCRSGITALLVQASAALERRTGSADAKDARVGHTVRAVQGSVTIGCVGEHWPLLCGGGG